MAQNEVADWRARHPMWTDEETSLQLSIGPFRISQNRDYIVWNTDPKACEEVIGTFPDIFDAHAFMIAEYRQWFASKPNPVVYFIGTTLEKGGRIKVGHTRHLRARLCNLQTGSPDPLTVFATTPGDRELEQRYHRKFKFHRISGEWFNVVRPIREEIERLNTPSQAEAGL